MQFKGEWLISKYTVFIDESGEAGIENVRTDDSGGASPYMTLGAALIETSRIEEFRDHLRRICLVIGKDTLHCKNMRHFQKLYFARELNKLPVTCFGIISLKSTLGWYNERIEGDSKLYYNKCAQLLLECVGDFMKSNGVYSHQLDVVFEAGNFDYKKLRNLIRKCQERPIRDRIKLLRNIDADNIHEKPKADEPLLQMSDLVAHSLYKCVDKSRASFSLTEPRYLIELKDRLFRDAHTQMVIGKGVQPIYSLGHLKLDDDIKSALLSLNNVQC